MSQIIIQLHKWINLLKIKYKLIYSKKVFLKIKFKKIKKNRIIQKEIFINYLKLSKPNQSFHPKAKI